MAKKNQNNSENKTLYKDNIYHEFVTWFAMPQVYRLDISGIKDQQEFAEHYKVSKDTLSLWKKRPGFDQLVDKARQSLSQEKTPDVIQAIYRGALKGNATSQKLWMKIFKPNGFESKNTLPTVTVDDIRFLIEVLPEHLQEKYNTMLIDLFHDGKKYLTEEYATKEKMNERRPPDYYDDNPIPSR